MSPEEFCQLCSEPWMSAYGSDGFFLGTGDLLVVVPFVWVRWIILNMSRSVGQGLLCTGQMDSLGKSRSVDLSPEMIRDSRWTNTSGWNIILCRCLSG